MSWRVLSADMASAGRTVLLFACALTSAAAYHVQLPRGHVVTSLLAGSSSAAKTCKAVEGATASDGWCAKSCSNAPAVCPPEICECTSIATLEPSSEATEAEKAQALLRVKAKEEKAKEDKKAEQVKAKQDKKKAEEATAALRDQGAPKQMSLSDFVKVKQAKDSLPEAPALRVETKPKDHKPKDLDKKVAELNKKGEERMHLQQMAYGPQETDSDGGGPGLLRAPTDSEKEAAIKKSKVEPKPTEVVSTVALVAPTLAVGNQNVSLVQQEQPKAADPPAPDDMATIVAKLNREAEERNKKAGTNLAPGLLRSATAAEKASTLATQQPQGEPGQQKDLPAQQQEQEQKQVAPKQEKPQESEAKGASTEPATDKNAEQAAYDALRKKAEQE